MKQNYWQSVTKITVHALATDGGMPLNVNIALYGVPTIRSNVVTTAVPGMLCGRSYVSFSSLLFDYIYLIGHHPRSA